MMGKDVFSLDEIEPGFLADRDMYLSANLSDTFYLEIYHSKEEDAEDDECEVLLQVGGDEAFEAGESVDLHSDGTPRLEAIIKQFKLDRKKVMWGVSADVVHTPSAKEMRDSGRSEEQIQLML
jgi:hypothetical protein